MSNEQKNPEKILGDEREYVQMWFNSKNLSDRDVLNGKAKLNTFLIDYRNMHKVYSIKASSNKEKPIRPIERQALKEAFEEYVDSRHNASIAYAIDNIKYDEETDKTLVDQFIAALTGSQEPKNSNVIKHWLWSIKRKALDLPVVYHIMPVIYGAQGVGKSIAVDKLLQPISEYILHSSMEDVIDPRNFLSRSINLVNVLDEMAGSAKADIDKLKAQITKTENSYRTLYSHTNSKVPNRVSYIGTTNRRLNELVWDPSGMRRFFEIVVLSNNREKINSINYVNLWKSIDENLEYGYLTDSSLEEVLEEQKQYVAKEVWQEFADEMAIPVVDPSKVVAVNSKVLYAKFAKWSADSGNQLKLSQGNLVRKFKNNKYRTESVRYTGQSHSTEIYINSEHLLHTILTPHDTYGTNITQLRKPGA